MRKKKKKHDVEMEFLFYKSSGALEVNFRCVLGVNMALKSDRWFAKLIL